MHAERGCTNLHCRLHNAHKTFRGQIQTAFQRTVPVPPYFPAKTEAYRTVLPSLVFGSIGTVLFTENEVILKILLVNFLNSTMKILL